ncbi:hypothetical protein [Paenibacillus tundrae]|uniref:Uncharacterized protein n=1 Tax=Paenibacillus tundrae TaxID=528187 RepID=A0ABT9W7F0_9BACL|nr:hypothetical protein [Paenibacillus tundrae]MDQ0169156.1 hypothetical protein [Paenibacillus tundrae]
MESNGVNVEVNTVGSEVIRSLSRPYKTDAEFDGKYHHVGFQWWTYDIWSSGFQASMLTHLEYLDREELYEFVAQLLRRICDNKQPKGEALRGLLEAAFGTQDSRKSR